MDYKKLAQATILHAHWYRPHEYDMAENEEDCSYKYTLPNGRSGEVSVYQCEEFEKSDSNKEVSISFGGVDKFYIVTIYNGSQYTFWSQEGFPVEIE